MNIKNSIRLVIAEAAQINQEEISVEHPEVEEFGEYSTNIALVMKGGRRLAEEIAARMEKNELIDNVSVAGAGFINIKLKTEIMINELAGIDQKYGRSDIGRGKKVVVDYSAPNVAKPFGIGHLRSTIIGQAIYNLYEYLGYEVIGDNHIGDWGTQFGKLLYMIDKKVNQDINIENLEKWYVEFHKLEESEPDLSQEARRWFKKLEDGDQEARVNWQKCVDISMKEFGRIYDLLGIKIDYAYGESSYETLMPEVIEDADRKKIAVQSDGARVIEIPGDKTPLMLVKSDGGTTYATRDLATIKFRKSKWNPDLIVYEVGGEQTLHFHQVFEVAKMLDYVSDTSSMIHMKHGMYLATDGKKFSTREGKTIKLEEVLNEAILKAKKMGDGNSESAKEVGIGAIKYFDLMHNVQSDIIFDWEKILNLEGNSGPYLQYTYARTQSIKAKSDEFMVHGKVEVSEINPEELRILRWIYRFPEVVEEAAKRFSPNLVCSYLYELAQRFNSFYNQHSILSADNSDLIVFRLKLTNAVGQVLKNGLELLGIAALERM
jgi:arginyl-tRNA synthetase